MQGDCGPLLRILFALVVISVSGVVMREPVSRVMDRVQTTMVDAIDGRLGACDVLACPRLRLLKEAIEGTACEHAMEPRRVPVSFEARLAATCQCGSAAFPSRSDAMAIYPQ